MQLSKTEFDSLVRIPWTERLDNDGRLFYTPVDETYTRLFNLDVLRQILVKKFKQQTAITRLPHYDVSAPIVLYPDLRLVLPSELEAIDYFYNMTIASPPTFIIDTSSSRALGFCILLFLIVTIVSVFCSRIHLKNNSFVRLLNSRII